MGGEYTEKLTAMNVVTEAERFALQRRIQPTQLLILDTGTRLLKESFRLNASLLVLPIPPVLFAESVWRVVPLYFDVLASNLKVVVISSEPVYKRTAVTRPADPFQNIRHNCLLHIVLDAPHKFSNSLFVNTLLWNRHGVRFFCVRHYDHMVFWVLNASMELCSPNESACSMGNIVLGSSRVPRKLGSYAKLLQSTVICGNVAIETSFKSEIRTTHYEKVMMHHYAIYRSKTLECFSFMSKSVPRISALLEPFKAEVWILTSLSAFVLAAMISRLEVDTFPSLSARTLTSFIGGAGIRADVRRFSHLPLLGCLVALIFFMGQVYTNSFTSFLLDPRILRDCEETLDCHRDLKCYSRAVLGVRLSRSGTCVCNINQKQQSLIEKPVHRMDYTNRKNLNKYERLSDLYIQKDLSVLPDVSASRGQLLLVPTRVSGTIDRLIKTGILSQRLLHHSDVEVEKFRSSRLYREFYQPMEHRTIEYEAFFDFDTPCDSFDTKTVLQILPLFGACVIVVLLAFWFEILARG